MGRATRGWETALGIADRVTPKPLGSLSGGGLFPRSGSDHPCQCRGGRHREPDEPLAVRSARDRGRSGCFGARSRWRPRLDSREVGFVRPTVSVGSSGHGYRRGSRARGLMVERPRGGRVGGNTGESRPGRSVGRVSADVVSESGRGGGSKRWSFPLSNEASKPGFRSWRGSRGRRGFPRVTSGSDGCRDSSRWPLTERRP